MDVLAGPPLGLRVARLMTRQLSDELGIIDDVAVVICGPRSGLGPREARFRRKHSRCWIDMDEDALSLPPESLWALLAHELGHHGQSSMARKFSLVSLLAVSGCALAWLAAVRSVLVEADIFVISTVMLGVPAAFWLMRRDESAADHAATETVGTDAVVGWLSQLGQPARPPNVLQRMVLDHPTPEQRTRAVRRLPFVAGEERPPS